MSPPFPHQTEEGNAFPGSNRLISYPIPPFRDVLPLASAITAARSAIPETPPARPTPPDAG